MVKVRQDAWSHEDDLLLAETVLRHIREGSTQLNAFEEVGDKLNRTSAACGFRWNAEVRQRYEQAVAIAKRQRKEKKRAQAREQKAEKQRIPQPSPVSFASSMKEELNENQVEDNDTQQVDKQSGQDTPAMKQQQVQAGSINLDYVIDYLSTLKQEHELSNQSKNTLEMVQSENEQLKEENQSLQKKITKLQEQLNTIQEDYQVLIQIMDRARKMVVFDDEDSVSTPAFRMEKNGNLEQVAK
ncbi:RsfA family transcriptional regulator [Aquibacillus sediminis]|uniref:RsfA family transcriptional regulator n=1 Tax=Aquibacillus sediminis TaxID=2574734 RepID=UPI00110925ED|nr:RsfA family transcriptional regulator [Aquibacillus sediminis]